MSIERYVSNSDGRVFTLKNLPPEVVAVLFARYSRSPLGLREELAAMLREEGDPGDRRIAEVAGGDDSLAAAEERAARFHERFVVGYGHSSVAEHAMVSLGLEGVSVLAAKAIEERRIGVAYTEKSTRYVRFDRGSLLRDIGLPADLQHVYEKTADSLLDTYERLADRVELQLEQRDPAVNKASRRAKACDLLRGLLPAGVRTNMGLTGNARAIAHMIRSLREDGVPEFGSLSDQIQAEASLVVPTLLRHTKPSSHRSGAKARVQEVAERLAVELYPQEAVRGMRQHLVNAFSAHGASAEEVATSILMDCRTPEHYYFSLTEGQAIEVINAYLADRGQHDAVGRSLERAVFSWDITCDYGAWRDLHRHRLVTATRPMLTADLGFWRLEELDELGVADEFDEACDAVVGPYAQIAAFDKKLAQYVVPLAFRVNYSLSMNMREAFHLIELRSGSAGHPSYRMIAQRMAEDVLAECPWTADHLRVDMDRYAYARENAGRKK